jgi:probable DNA repair protein
MYEWLSDALQGPATVITANRRLARVLQEEFAQQQLRAGKEAWRSPSIHSWQSWLEKMLLGATNQVSLPTRINQHQSQLLWERCLNKEVAEHLPGLSGLVRLSRDTWQRLAEWHLTIGEVARSAQNGDQRLFAAAAGRYLGILERERWIDDAGLGSLVDDLIRSGRTATGQRITLVGFDRERPVVTSITAALTDNGCDVQTAPAPHSADSVALQCFETADAELRAAGAWAREQLEKNPDHTIAIIAANLDQDAERKSRLVREGLVPGWQYAPSSVRHAVNVSYGRKLIDFPAVSIAVLLLRWLVRDLSTGEVGHLLRTPLLGPNMLGGRSRMELHLRQLPDRRWSPAMLSHELRGREESADSGEWLSFVASMTKLRRELQRKASPAKWATYIDTTLKASGWPGRETVSSFDFQLVNRWRDLLNDLARLDLVSPVMTLQTAIRRLELMAAETVFQPESVERAVHLMGPLEASGAQFDAIWISGLTAANWPPAGNPSPLVSRRLQRQAGMPDAEPADTVAYARSLLTHLCSAADTVVGSYPLTEADAEQTPSDLLNPLGVKVQAARADPGWHAAALSATGHTAVVDDTVPKMCSAERLRGGADTLQRQLSDPISAFAVGRLGIRRLQQQAKGLPASLRGNIIHDALYQLYADTPSRNEILGWSDDELTARTDRAIESTFARHERNADDVLSELLKLERQRVADLLRQLVRIEQTRAEFAIASVEHEVVFAEAGVRMQLRIDRIDRLSDGTLAVLDYKTGAKKKLLQNDGQPREIQLIAYACALTEPVSALALVNVDTREVGFDGAGRGYSDDLNWRDTLAAWKRIVRAACEDMSDGDVRINGVQGIQDARNFNLLSRYTELRRDG